MRECTAQKLPGVRLCRGTAGALVADRRNYYKVEKWSRDGQRVEEMLFAGEQPLEGPAYLRAVRDVNVPVAFLRSAEWPARPQNLRN